MLPIDLSEIPEPFVIAVAVLVVYCLALAAARATLALMRDVRRFRRGE